ncbi:hypothetical protein [Novosphingobium sp. JCM 18896]|uniref:hypothetical protein n=1 Tax=Novosphingobium sp. JCM 18896 TaxID=2989731 RepID=UPI0022217D95|nr:hypothetical protein [Novosphingobium sp. JCM 18896]MCW1427505.1 hypothetical protein [Novosphingobium sp. JCM 18896]
MTGTDKIVAIGLLTERELKTVARDLKDIYLVPRDGEFDDLLRRVREATRKRG